MSDFYLNLMKIKHWRFRKRIDFHWHTTVLETDMKHQKKNGTKTSSSTNLDILKITVT